MAEGTRRGQIKSWTLNHKVSLMYLGEFENLCGQFVLGGREVAGMATEEEVVDVWLGS